MIINFTINIFKNDNKKENAYNDITDEELIEFIKNSVDITLIDGTKIY